MSTLSVDNITGQTTAANVKIPGHVIQVVAFRRPGLLSSQSSLAELTTTSFSDVMSKAIVTKSANSKIYVAINCVGYSGSGQGEARISTKVLRDSTQIDADKYGVYLAQNEMSNISVHILDEPNVSVGTTLTYKLQAANQVGANTYKIGYGDSGGGSSASITLMEIAQ